MPGAMGECFKYNSKQYVKISGTPRCHPKELHQDLGTCLESARAFTTLPVKHPSGFGGLTMAGKTLNLLRRPCCSRPRSWEKNSLCSCFSPAAAGSALRHSGLPVTVSRFRHGDVVGSAAPTFPNALGVKFSHNLSGNSS